jgi:hypothetical protein
MRCEVGHVQTAVWAALGGPEEAAGAVAQDGADQLLSELVVPGRNGRVGREDALPAYRLDILLRRLLGRTPVEVFAQQLERQQCGVPLVHVVARDGAVPAPGEHARAPGPEHDLLRQPVSIVAAVERVGQSSIPRAVLREGRVEHV